VTGIWEYFAIKVLDLMDTVCNLIILIPVTDSSSCDSYKKYRILSRIPKSAFPATTFLCYNVVIHSYFYFTVVKRNAHKISVEKPEGKRPRERPKRIWEDNIRMDLWEIGWEVVGWMHLAQDRDPSLATVKTIMNLRAA
jgi:hypothetical protein